MKRKRKKCDIFLEVYRSTGSITRACKAAKMWRSQHYARMKTDARYRRVFEEAREEAVGVMEDECLRRAVEGWLEPVTYQGRISQMRDPETRELVPVTIRKFSDSNLQFLLRGAKPHIYRERFNVQHSGAVANLKFAGQLPDLLALYHELTHDTSDEEEQPPDA